MKTKVVMLALFILAFQAAAPFSARAQRNRPDRGISNRSLPTLTRDLSDRAIEAVAAARARGETYPMEVYLALGAFSGRALALAQLAADGRPEPNLREGARLIIQEARAIDTVVNRSTGGRFEWRLLQQQLGELSDYFSLGYNPPRGRGRGGDWGAGDRGPTGRFRWEGRVDGRDEIVVRGDRVNIRHLEHGPITDARFDFVEPLPRQTVNVRLTKLAGRGRVELVEQPSNRNGWAALILIDDPDAGSDVYRFELDW